MTDSPLTQRDVESLRTTLDKLDRTLERFQREAAENYVRKDVLAPMLDAIRADVDDVASDLNTMAVQRLDDQKAEKQFRRQILAGVAVGLILLLASTSVQLGFLLLGRS